VTAPGRRAGYAMGLRERETQGVRAPIPERKRPRGALSRAAHRALGGPREALARWRRGALWLWSRRPTARRAAAWVFVAAGGTVAIAAVLAQARVPASLPSARDWGALRALLEREARPGDALALSPPWAERAREIVPPSVPVLAYDGYAREDLLGIRRIWVASLRGVPGFSWSVEKDVLERTARAERPQRLGAFEVTRYDLAVPTLPLAFLPDRLASAEVSRGGRPCLPDPAGVFVCDGPGAASLARDVREVGGAPRPCLVATLPDGPPLVISFPPGSVGRTLRGRAGAPDAPSLGGPLRVTALFGDEEVGSAEVSGAGFVSFHIDTARFAGVTRPLTLALSTPGAQAVVCLEAALLP
jgi:hypothetical protein